MTRDNAELVLAMMRDVVDDLDQRQQDFYRSREKRREEKNSLASFAESMEWGRRTAQIRYIQTAQGTTSLAADYLAACIEKGVFDD